MPREIRKTTIDGVEYTVRQVGAKTGRQILLRVAKVLPSLLMGGAFGPGDLSGDDLDFVCDSMLADAKVAIEDPHNPGLVTVVPLPAQFDNHFAGRYVQLFKLLAFAWEANEFSQVFREVGNITARRTASPTSESPPAATGTSTASSSPPA